MKTQDLNERFLLAFYINNILIINDMRSKGFKAKFMMAFWGLFVEAHYIAADNDTMEGSQGILPFIILLIVSICVIAFLSYYMYRLKKEYIAKDGELMARNDELLRSVDALSVKNREIQQMLVNKINSVIIIKILFRTIPRFFCTHSIFSYIDHRIVRIIVFYSL